MRDLSLETPPLILSRHPMAPLPYGRVVARMAGRSDISRVPVARFAEAGSQELLRRSQS
jgi:hypothetical protein